MSDGVKGNGIGEDLSLDLTLGDGTRVEMNFPTREGKRKMKTMERLEAYASAMSRQEYINAYNSITYDSVVLRIRHDGGGEGVMKGLTRDHLKAAAAAAGMSMSEFILCRACESMRRRGEVFPAVIDGGNASKNRELIIRGDAAGYLIDAAAECEMEPRELVVSAVERFVDEERGEGGQA